MSDLRKATIRLAYANPALRPHLLPLLKSAAPEEPVTKQAGSMAKALQDLVQRMKQAVEKAAPTNKRDLHRVLTAAVKGWADNWRFELAAQPADVAADLMDSVSVKLMVSVDERRLVQDLNSFELVHYKNDVIKW